jgi:hypothetical protein
MSKWLHYLSSLCLGLGFISLISPIFLYWFIHGNYERYVWIINGPYPFSHFGGGPFQMAMGLALVFIGCIFVGISIFINNINSLQK